MPENGSDIRKNVEAGLKAIDLEGQTLQRKFKDLGTVEKETGEGYDRILAALPKDAKIRRQIVEKFKPIALKQAEVTDTVMAPIETVWPMVQFALIMGKKPLAAALPINFGRNVIAGIIRGASKLEAKLIEGPAKVTHRTMEVTVPKGKIDEAVAKIIPKDYEVLLDTANMKGVEGNRRILAAPKSLTEGNLHISFDPPQPPEAVSTREPVPSLADNQRLVGVGKSSA